MEKFFHSPEFSRHKAYIKTAVDEEHCTVYTNLGIEYCVSTFRPQRNLNTFTSAESVSHYGAAVKVSSPPSSATPSDKGTKAPVPGDMFCIGLL